MSTGTTRPRTTINDLPYELKRYIAQLCVDEDEHFDAWTHAIEEQQLGNVDDDEGTGMFTDVEESRIASLFEVSLEWAELAAPFRFKTLKHGKATSSDDTVLRERIVPLRLEHVKEHDLREASSEIVLAAIPLIGPAARALKLDEASLAVLGDTLRHGREDARRMLAGLPARHLYNPGLMKGVTNTLYAARTLRSLCIEVTRQSNVVAALHLIVTAAPSLEHLDISATGPIPECLMEVLGPAPSAKRPALQSFIFKAPHLTLSLLDFVTSFAQFLRQLSLNINDSTAVAASLPLGVVFPNLGDLTLGGAFSSLEPLLNSAQVSTFPRLLRLKLLIERVVMNARSRCPLHKLDKLLLPSSHPHPTLRAIHLFNPMRMFAPRELEYLERIARTRYAAYDILLTPERLFPSRALMFDAGWHAMRSAASTARAARDVKRTIAFLQRWCDRIQADGDEDGTEMGRLAELLTTAEFERVASGL
ncbi:hypothetical protein JCM10450v2_008244 [Rhodotorula kratochvilovae]